RLASLTPSQSCLGRATETGLAALTPARLSSSRNIQPETLAPRRGGNALDVVAAAAATGNARLPEPTVGFSYSSKRTIETYGTLAFGDTQPAAAAVAASRHIVYSVWKAAVRPSI